MEPAKCEGHTKELCQEYGLERYRTIGMFYRNFKDMCDLFDVTYLNVPTYLIYRNIYENYGFDRFGYCIDKVRQKGAV